jgi:hypothetical protein
MPNKHDLTVEGLAAQLYSSDAVVAFAWWHALREDIKKLYRERATAKIAEFNERNAAPWDKPAGAPAKARHAPDAAFARERPE